MPTQKINTSVVFKQLSWIIVSLVFLLGTSCKTTQKAGTLRLKKRKPDFLLEQLRQKKVDAEWLSAKAAIDYEDQHQRVKLTANIRFRKDSLIWMNIKKLGVEAARLQITPDSVYLLDRMKKTYFIENTAYLLRQSGLPTYLEPYLDFRALQNLLLGNPVFLPVKKMEASIDGDNYLLSGEYDDIQSRYWLYGRDYTLSKIQLEDTYDSKQASFVFEDYKPINESQNYSYFRTIRMENAAIGNVAIEMKLSKIVLNEPTTIRFTIPTRYTRLE